MAALFCRRDVCMRNSRVVDHSHDNNIDIQPEHVDIDEVYKSHRSNGVPGWNPDCYYYPKVNN